LPRGVRNRRGPAGFVTSRPEGGPCGPTSHDGADRRRWHHCAPWTLRSALARLTTRHVLGSGYWCCTEATSGADAEATAHTTHHNRQLRETRTRASCVRRTREARVASGSVALRSRRWFPLSERWTVSHFRRSPHGRAALSPAPLSAVWVTVCCSNASSPPGGCSIGGWSNLEIR